MNGGITNKQLSEALRKLNLPHTGKKNDLLDRLGWAELSSVDPDVFILNTTQENWVPKFETSGPVIKRIPKASRIQACKSLTDILVELTEKNDNASWEKLLQYPRLIFGGTVRGGKKKKSLATIIN